MFYGWGEREVIWDFDETIQVVLRYQSVHIMWVLWLAYRVIYEWSYPTPQGYMTRPVTPEEMQQYRVKEHLSIHWYKHYSLWVFLGALAVTLAVLTATGVLT